MQHLNAIKNNEELVSTYGIGDAHLIWTLGLYFDESDLERLVTDGLTDGGGDRKIDFITQINSTLFIVQGYYSIKSDFKVAAPSNKASDLNTAMAWLVAGDESKVPQKLRGKITEVRELIDSEEIDSIEILYIHNCAESENVRSELETCADYLKNSFSNKDIDITYKELGRKNIEKLYISLSQQILVIDNIELPTEFNQTISGDGWTSYIGVVGGQWLYDLYQRYNDELFSANYRGFMGLKRKKINKAIKFTAEKSPKDFFVYNNGISLLTTKFNESENKIEGISIINGAQTTGSIGSIQNTSGLEHIEVMCRIIVSSDSEKVKSIVKYNNTQNHITTWDHYANSPEQKLLVEEFKNFGYEYSLKRGFSNVSSLFGIESVAQPLTALHGDYANANRGKNYVFEIKTAYDNAFHESKAQHILLAYCISKAVEKVKRQLKSIEYPIDQQKDSLAFNQSLKSKFFIIAIVGKILDVITGKPVNPKLVKFTYNTSLSKNYTIDQLIEMWVPVINSILPIIIQQTGTDLNNYLTTESEPLEKASLSVKNMLSSLQALQPIESLQTIKQHIE